MMADSVPDHLEPVGSSLGPGQSIQPARAFRSRWAGLLEWSSASAPVALLLLAGLCLGPYGINLLSWSVLSSLDPVVPVAAGGLGVLVGLGTDIRRPDEPRIMAAAVMGTIAGVAVAVAALGVVLTIAPDPWSLALIVPLGICSASSLTPSTLQFPERPAIIPRILRLGVVIPILAGVCLLAWPQAGSVAGTLGLLAQAAGITVALAAAAWLLLSRASSATDERVISASALLLVGGLGEALSLSALWTGLVAGLFWNYTGGQPRESLQRDALLALRPLLVLVLLVAGARADLTLPSLGLGVAYVIARLLGQSVAAIVAGRGMNQATRRDLVHRFASPGVFGVAFALEAASRLGSDGSVVLVAVVIGTIGCDFWARCVSPQRSDE
jgi:hypothetical protein